MTLLRTEPNRAAMSQDHSLPPNDLDDQDRDIAVATEKPALKKPPLYKVILLNDDYTPMDFVVLVLEHFFRMNREKRPRSCCTSMSVVGACAGSSPVRLLKPRWRKSTNFRAAISTRCYVQWKKPKHPLFSSR